MTNAVIVVFFACLTLGAALTQSMIQSHTPEKKGVEKGGAPKYEWCMPAQNAEWAAKEDAFQAEYVKNYVLHGNAKRMPEFMRDGDSAPEWLHSAVDPDEERRGRTRFLKYAVQKAADLKNASQRLPRYLQITLKQEETANKRWAACKAISLWNASQEIPAWMNALAREARAENEARTEKDSFAWTRKIREARQREEWYDRETAAVLDEMDRQSAALNAVEGVPFLPAQKKLQVLEEKLQAKLEEVVRAKEARADAYDEWYKQTRDTKIKATADANYMWHKNLQDNRNKVLKEMMTGEAVGKTLAQARDAMMKKRIEEPADVKAQEPPLPLPTLQERLANAKDRLKAKLDEVIKQTQAAGSAERAATPLRR